MEKKRDKTLAAAIILFWLLAGAYFVGQKYLSIEGGGDEAAGPRLVDVTPDKLNQKVLDAELLADPAFKALTKSAVPLPAADGAKAGNRSPFSGAEKTSQ